MSAKQVLNATQKWVPGEILVRERDSRCRRNREAHRPLENPEGIGPDGGGEVLGLVHVMHREEAEPNEVVSVQVAIFVLAVAEGKGKAKKVEPKRRRARINQDEHRNVGGRNGRVHTQWRSAHVHAHHRASRRSLQGYAQSLCHYFSQLLVTQQNTRPGGRMEIQLQCPSFSC